MLAARPQGDSLNQMPFRMPCILLTPILHRHLFSSLRVYPSCFLVDFATVDVLECFTPEMVPRQV